MAEGKPKPEDKDVLARKTAERLIEKPEILSDLKDRIENEVPEDWTEESTDEQER